MTEQAPAAAQPSDRSARRRQRALLALFTTSMVAGVVSVTWADWGDPPVAVVIVGATGAGVVATMIATGAFRWSRLHGRGVTRSFGRAVWELVKAIP